MDSIMSQNDTHQVHCLKCDFVCGINTSQSAKNPGKRYWQCPNKCLNTWNGWLDSTQCVNPQSIVSPQVSTLSAAATTNNDPLHTAYRLLQEATNLLQAANIPANHVIKCYAMSLGGDEQQQHHHQPAVLTQEQRIRSCTKCNEQCQRAVSKSEKNPNRAYYKCSKCATFNGWEATQQQQSLAKVQDENSQGSRKSKASLKRARGKKTTMVKKKTSVWKPQKTMVSLF